MKGKRMSKVISAEEIGRNWQQLNDEVKGSALKAGRQPEDITIIPVSKTHPVEMVYNAMEAGVRLFGENYAQELKDKHEHFEKSGKTEPEWHFIGHLQSNKVKYIAPYVSMIHSVDSVKLAKEISKRAVQNEREIDILIQVNTSGEESKSGCEPGELESIIREVNEFENLKIKGLMTIAGLFGSDEENRKEFRLLKELLDDMKSKFPNNELKHLSMGMTGDFRMAIEEGSTMVRVGTALFGARDYSANN